MSPRSRTRRLRAASAIAGQWLLGRIGRRLAGVLRAARRTAAHQRAVLVDADMVLLAVRVGDFCDVERLAARGLLLDGADRPALGLLRDRLLHGLRHLVHRHRLALASALLLRLLRRRGAHEHETRRQRGGGQQRGGHHFAVGHQPLLLFRAYTRFTRTSSTTRKRETSGARCHAATPQQHCERYRRWWCPPPPTGTGHGTSRQPPVPSATNVASITVAVNRVTTAFERPIERMRTRWIGFTALSLHQPRRC